LNWFPWPFIPGIHPSWKSGACAIIETTAKNSSVLTRLRCETRAEHDAIEAVLNLTGAALTRHEYRRTLERFYGYYRPFEEAILAIAEWAGKPGDLEDRRKSPFLDLDLRMLGVDAPELLPVCHQLPLIDSAASAFGGLYVMEGATLGGQFISRHVRQVLGVASETGGRFFHGYGERTGNMWETFRTALDAFATTQTTQDQVVVTAVQTFRTLRAWFLQGNSV
jgi:heme oxygenase